MNEKSVDKAIRSVLGREMTGGDAACPDHNLLAAYLEGRLRGAGQAALEAHAADCAKCQQVLAMAAKLDPETSAGIPVYEASNRKLLFRITIPVSALALIIAAIAIGVIFLRTSNHPGGAPPTIQMADVSTPAQVPPSQPENVSKDLAASGSTPEPRISAAKEQVRQRTPEPKAKKGEPAREAVIRAGPAAVTPAAVREAVELPVERAETLPLAASKAEIRSSRGEDVSPNRVMQAKGAIGEIPGGVVGGVIGGVARAPQSSEVKNIAASSLVEDAPVARDAILESGRQLQERDASRWKKVGDRGFRFASGYWIDERCAQNPHATIVEIRKGAAEFEAILKLYPDLGRLLPAAIFWNEKIWILR